MNKVTKLEIEGKTVEEAVKAGLKELNASRDQVKIEILCEEEKGLFGMPGAKMAKIRVTLVNNNP
ncbi:MAG: Jag N-terminal domain-containing protein [Candidatus Omnitrophica bacterium]|nr:Jag N-terminal domain-containing protein [Candidatus Omnitrophota bacterium]